MDTSINQPAGTNPLQQPSVQTPPMPSPTMPSSAPPVPPTPPASADQYSQPSAPPPQHTATGHGKRTLLLFIILLIVLAICGYVIFVKTQADNMKQIPVQPNTSVVVPSNTPIPTAAVPESAEEIEVESPEEDLLDIDTEVNAL